MSKESHGFNPDVAVAIGVNSAIIFGHLIFLHKCLLGKKDDWDGTRFWIKKTATAFAKTYPYFTSKEIRGALDRMEKAGLIISQTGVDVNRFDRTKGYSIEVAGFDLMETNEDERQVNPFDKRANAETQKGKSDVPKRANQMFPKGQMNNSYIPYTDLSLKEKEETANAEPLPKIEIEPSKDPADKRHEWTPQAEDLKAKGIAAKAAGEAEEKLTTLRNKYNAVRAKIRTEENIDLVIQHLNRETEMKRGFDIESATYRATVRKRLQKNTVEEILAVTTFKCKKWKNDSKMRCQLKPSVLYNGHFEEYLVEIELDSKPIVEKPKNETVYTPPPPKSKPQMFHP